MPRATKLLVITLKWTVTVNIIALIWNPGASKAHCLNLEEWMCLKWELGSWKWKSKAVQEAIFLFRGHELFLVLRWNILKQSRCVFVCEWHQSEHSLFFTKKEWRGREKADSSLPPSTVGGLSVLLTWQLECKAYELLCRCRLSLSLLACSCLISYLSLLFLLPLSTILLKILYLWYTH